MGSRRVRCILPHQSVAQTLCRFNGKLARLHITNGSERHRQVIAELCAPAVEIFDARTVVFLKVLLGDVRNRRLAFRFPFRHTELAAGNPGLNFDKAPTGISGSGLPTRTLPSNAIGIDKAKVPANKFSAFGPTNHFSHVVPVWSVRALFCFV